MLLDCCMNVRRTRKRDEANEKRLCKNEDG